jgi:hypothetical protein
MVILQVTTCIYNLIVGKLYIDHFGTMKIQGNGNLVCKLKFKEQTIMDRNPHQVLWILASDICIVLLNLLFELKKSSPFRFKDMFMMEKKTKWLPYLGDGTRLCILPWGTSQQDQERLIL